MVLQKMAALFATTIILTSCHKDCEDVDGYLTAEESSWLSYQGGETLIFHDSSQTVDTFKVSPKNIYSNLGYQESEDNCEHHQQVGEFVISDNMGRTFFMVVSHHNEWNTGGAGILY